MKLTQSDIYDPLFCGRNLGRDFGGYSFISDVKKVVKREVGFVERDTDRKCMDLF